MRHARRILAALRAVALDPTLHVAALAAAVGLSFPPDEAREAGRRGPAATQRHETEPGPDTF